MLLNDLQTKRPWDDVANYGEYDTSAAPAYGQYDIVPIEADVEALARYEFFTDSGRSTAGKIYDSAKAGGLQIYPGALWG